MNRRRVFQSNRSHGKFKWIGLCLNLPSFFCFTSCSGCWGNHAIWQPQWQRSSKQKSVTVIASYSEAMQRWCVCVRVCMCRWIKTHIQCDWANQSFRFDLMQEFPSHNKDLVQEVRDVGCLQQTNWPHTNLMEEFVGKTNAACKGSQRPNALLHQRLFSTKRNCFFLVCLTSKVGF